MSGSSGAPSRFYQSVFVSHTPSGFEVLLDERPLKTKGGNKLVAPTEKLADAVRAEWEAQGETIDLTATPLTNLLAGAIDADAAPQWHADIIGYLKSDLLCYRAEAPAALTERQADAWDEYLDWARTEFGAALVVTAGVMSVPQPDIAAKNIEAALAGADRELLAGLRTATAITGSAILALALWKRFRTPAKIFAASIVDESFQAEQWGDDAEASARRELIEQEFNAVARYLQLLGDD